MGVKYSFKDEENFIKLHFCQYSLYVNTHISNYLYFVFMDTLVVGVVLYFVTVVEEGYINRKKRVPVVNNT